MFGPFKPAPHIAELPAEKLILLINAYVGRYLQESSLVMLLTILCVQTLTWLKKV
ncbi:glycerol-3-phosphate transporter [Rodentibacter pneumotropicus]|uniref:Glycerol-3-phosphate transporter n=1 Tax=Rodentibacter pneumotropicus TaxID=758 RepID=A0A448MIK5_9PAST|nr:glycerol-3-phosphate transporter [Rodentibacter pneumotropicus]